MEARLMQSRGECETDDIRAGSSWRLTGGDCSTDPEAFEALVGCHRDRLVAVALRVVRDRDSAEDIVQETLLVAWRSLTELRDPAALSAWLAGIARNKAKMVVRKRSRESLCDAPERTDGELHEAASCPREQLFDREIKEYAAYLLDQLSASYRDPLVLFYGQMHSVNEIARHLGTSEAAVKQRLSRGRQKLREVARRHGPRPHEMLAALVPVAA